MGEVVVLSGLPEGIPDKQYREQYLPLARQIYRDRSEDSPEIKKIFRQFINHCPKCGADLNLSWRIAGKPKGRYPLFIATRRCGECHHEFRHMEGSWEYEPD